MAMRLYVDFNTITTDAKARVYINTQVQPALAKALQPGLVVTLYDEEMEVEALVEFDAHDQAWLGHPHWATRRDLPLSSGQPPRRAGPCIAKHGRIGRVASCTIPLSGVARSKSGERQSAGSSCVGAWAPWGGRVPCVYRDVASPEHCRRYCAMKCHMSSSFLEQTPYFFLRGRHVAFGGTQKG